MLRQLVTCAIMVAAFVAWATACPVKIIFDTDMIGDYDDVGAMAVLHKLADQGECEILATVSSTHSNASAGTVELLNTWYGRPDIPVGAVKGAGVGGGSEKHRSHIKYERLLAKYPKLWRHRNANDAPDATDVYRRALATQPDGSVTICTVGFLTNLRRLLQSPSDRHSPLDGRALVARKVKVWYAMGWKIPKGRECNIMNDPASARYVLENWPTPIVIDDFNYSQYIYAGRKVAALPDDGNPVRDIFAWCMPPVEKCPAASEIIPTGRFKDNVKEGHNCFDQSCVLGAVRGPGSFFDVERGRMEMVGDKGDNVWMPDPAGPHARMVDKWPRTRVAALIDDLMAAPRACAGSVTITGLETDHLVEPGHVGPKPSFAWRMETSRAGARQVSYRIRVWRRGAHEKTIWDSGEIEDGCSVGVVYGGAPLESARRYSWKVAVKDERGEWTESEDAHFSTGLFSDGDWSDAAWIAPSPSDGPYALRTGGFHRMLVNPKDVTEAWWVVAAAGAFEIYANGRTVTDDFLKPGFTHPLKVRQACTYDVTDRIDCHAGASNVFAAVVSPSWSRDKIACRSRPGRRLDPTLPPALRAVLILRHADGTETKVVTDDTWRAKMDCFPVRTSGIYEGEIVDARTSLDWLTCPEPEWPLAIKDCGGFAGIVRNFRGPPVRLRHDLAMRPVSAYVVKGATGVSADRHGTANVIRRAQAGMPEPMTVNAGEMLVLDFGQNASVVSEFVFEGVSGRGVELRFAEMLNEGNGEKSRGNDGPAGTPYLANLRTSYAGVRYTCRGGGPERYRPTFTFFGCRYASVTADGPLVVRSARSIPVTSVGQGADTGSFMTDNPRVNRLFENCRWGMYSNYLSVPTDCPQRDERVGWTADTQVFAPAAAYLANVQAFLAKWMADMRDSQRADGCFPWVAPEPWAPGYTIGWTDAGVIVPYILWRRYGDATAIEENWEAMCRYMAYVEKAADTDPQPFGDWLSYEYGADMEWLKPSRVKQQLPRKRFLSFAYRIWTDRMMAEMAQATGRAGDAARFHAREASDTAAFRAACLAKNGTILPTCDGQCSALYALLLDILPNEAAKASTRAALRENFRAHGNCLQTGFLGTAILLDAVTCGMDDPTLAYSLLLQDKDPSWLYSVDQGATTIWERWNSYTKERGFGPVSMNSFNHYAYGAVAGWMFSTMAGIRDDPAAPGFKHFVLAPMPDPRIGKVDASFRSPYGTIASKWEYDGAGGWKWTFTIPANTTATVVAPGQPAKEHVSGTYTIHLPRGS